MTVMKTAELKTLRAGWQPIETAPRDGTLVLLCGGRTDDEYGGLSETCKSQPVVAKWVDDDGGHYSPDVVPWWNWRFAWYDSGWHGIYEDPTHWMPLPDPPADHE